MVDNDTGSYVSSSLCCHLSPTKKESKDSQVGRVRGVKKADVIGVKQKWQ